MNIVILAAAGLSLAAPASGADHRYTVTDYDRVQVEGPFTVTVKTGKAPSARAIGSREAIERVSVEVQGRTLRIRPNRSAWGGYPGKDVGPVSLELTTHGLRAASLTGSGSLSVDKVKALRFDLTMSGSGKAYVQNLEADNFSLGQLGSGEVRLGGKVKTFRATIQGSGDFDGTALATDDAHLNAATSGTIAMTVQRSADITSSGSGETTISGKPACTVKNQGNGRVRCGSDAR